MAEWCTQADVLKVAPELADSRLGELDGTQWSDLISEGTLLVQSKIQIRYNVATIIPGSVPDPVVKWVAIQTAQLALNRYGGGMEQTERAPQIVDQLTHYRMLARNGSLPGMIPDYTPRAAV